VCADTARARGTLRRHQELLTLPASDETLTQIEKDLPRTMSHTGLMKPGARRTKRRARRFCAGGRCRKRVSVRVSRGWRGAPRARRRPASLQRRAGWRRWPLLWRPS
jgi:hypothetical protein